MTDANRLNQFYARLNDRLLSTAPSVDESCTQACVLLPFISINASPHLIFTRRTMTVTTHKGQIAFPGGIMEPSDSSADSTALREAHEEIGLHPDNVNVIGYMDGLRTVTDFWITPVVGVVKESFIYRPAEAEVAEVFEVPLNHLLKKSNWQFGSRDYKGTVYSDCRFPFKGHTIWGATGRLTWTLMEKLK